VQATFDRPPPSLNGVPGVTEAEINGRTLRCKVVGSMEPLMRTLADAGVRELLSTRPSLEELFLSHYGADSSVA
ncbi:MAG TPA: hypothetical protein VGK54_05455, partial [Chloroflexota bacterium]